MGTLLLANNSSMSWLGLIVIGLVGFFAITVMKMMVRQSVQKHSASGPNSSDDRAKVLPRPGALVGVIRSWIAPTVVMAVFASISGAIPENQLHWKFLQPAKDESKPLPVTPPPAVEEVTLISEKSIKNDESSKEESLPGWIREGNVTTGDVQRKVLASQLWTTEAEARHELASAAASLVRSDFDERHLNPLERPSRHFLSDDRIVSVAVKHQYIERVQQNFGSFTAPMSRLWWQVEVSPQVRIELYPAWKSAVTGNRGMFVGALLALVTLFANSAALFLKLRPESIMGTLRAASIVGTSACAWIGVDALAIKLLFV